MNYHMIRTDDMLNGSGLRVIIFLSGCEHRCPGCHNPETWDKNSGKKFSIEAVDEIIKELDKEYISGITFSGGEPLNEGNVLEVYELIRVIKEIYPEKSVWLYTGYTWEQINIMQRGISELNIKNNRLNNLRMEIVKLCDVLCDGKFIKSMADVNCPWVGSTNQRVIDVQRTLKEREIILYKA